MALGKVESVTPTRLVGTIIEDETGLSYPFDDPNFPNTGLAVGSPCTYDIDYSQTNPVATNLQPYVPTTRDITTDVSGPITVNPGETVTVKRGGIVRGNIIIGSATLVVEDTGAVEGEITVDNQGSFVARKGGIVRGNIIIGKGSVCKIVNKGIVRGNIIIGSANRFIVGNDAGGGIITGDITINKIRKVTVTASSTINGGVV